MRHALLAGAAALAIAGLSACSEKTQENIEKTGDSIGNDVSGSLESAGDRIGAGLNDAGQAIDQTGDRVGTAADEAAADAERETRKARDDVGGALQEAGKDIRNDN
ncbi:MAG: hypothetical protein QHC40_07705 [Sphingobium sp.]|nr:hypothetical protein [Sphingobium sp.]